MSSRREARLPSVEAPPCLRARGDRQGIERRSPQRPPLFRPASLPARQGSSHVRLRLQGVPSRNCAGGAAVGPSAAPVVNSPQTGRSEVLGARVWRAGDRLGRWVGALGAQGRRADPAAGRRPGLRLAAPAHVARLAGPRCPLDATSCPALPCPALLAGAHARWFGGQKSCRSVEPLTMIEREFPRHLRERIADLFRRSAS